jgi:hypothetical protein
VVQTEEKVVPAGGKRAKPGTGRARAVGLRIWLHKEHYDALEQLAAAEGMTRTALIEHWIEEHQRATGRGMVIREIRRAVAEGRLQEPFSKKDFKEACPRLAPGTYNAFLWKHAEGNQGGNTELFRKVAPGRFILLEPDR